MRAPASFLGAAACCALAAAPASAYEGRAHQTLTFIAAQHFNRCAGDIGATLLTPLQVRYIVKANVGQAEANMFRKMTRWSYYDRAGQGERSTMGIQTRMHQHFNGVAEALHTADNLAERYENLGRLINYLQDVTSPAHVVPVFFVRWWRFNVSDRFNGFPVREERFAAALEDDCAPLQPQVDAYASLLAATAARTLNAVQAPIPDMPATWEAFWRSDAPGGFGEYGDAGNNFGRQADFDCGQEGEQRCILLEDDPLYGAFAAARHLGAVRATMTAMWLLQRRQTAGPTRRAADAAHIARNGR